MATTTTTTSSAKSPLISIPSYVKGSTSTSKDSSRAFHLIRFPDPHPSLSSSVIDAPPVMQPGFSDSFSLPLHMRRELIPQIALTELEKKAGGEITHGKRGRETQADYNARRIATARHRDEFRWVIENSAATMHYEGKEVTEHSGQYIAVFPPDVPNGPYKVAKIDLWIDMRRWVDLSQIKIRASEKQKEQQMKKARKKNMQSAVDHVVQHQTSRKKDEEDEGQGDLYQDPDLEVDHVYDLAIDRAGLDENAFGDYQEQQADDDEGVEELLAGEGNDQFKEGVNDVVPDGELLESEEEKDDEDENGGSGPYSSSDEDYDRHSPTPSASAGPSTTPTLPVQLAQKQLLHQQAKRAKLDPLTEAVVTIIRTNGGKITNIELAQRLKNERLLDAPGAREKLSQVISKVARKVTNAVDGEFMTLRDEWQ